MIPRDEILELATVYSESPVFLTVYGDPRKREDRYVLDKRISAIRKALKGKRPLKEAFEANLERAEDELKGHQGPIAVYVSVEKDFLKILDMGMDFGPRMVVDSSPFIVPLLTYLDEYEPFIVIYIDENHARTYVVVGGVIVKEESMHEEIFHRHKKGGWSQMRFQRLRRGALEAFYDEVLENLEEVLSGEEVGRIIVSGPGIAKERFIERLPQHISEKVIGTYTIGLDDEEGELMKKAFTVFFGRERIEESEAVEALRSGILKGDGAVFGIQETYKATSEGRVDLILVTIDHSIPGFKCEKCRTAWHKTSKCQWCGEEGLPVDIVEELAERAVEMNTAMEFVKDSPELEELGHVGGLLRY